MVQLRGMGVWIKGKAVGMETYLEGGINRLGECKLWGEEAEETAIPLPYPLGHLPVAQRAWQTRPLPCSKPSLAPQPAVSQHGPGGNSSSSTSCAVWGKWPNL